MSNEIQIEFTPEFKRNLRVLAKKYRQIHSDIQPVIDRLQSGEVIGDQVTGSEYTVFKARVKIVTLKKGKVQAIE